jgi:hypothetical protein
MDERELDAVRPLMGREPEVKIILEQLQKALSGWGGKLAIVAESGVGKTRLAHEIILRARPMGARVVLVSCRGSLYRPHWPLAELSRLLLGIDGAAPRETQIASLIQTLADLGLSELTSVLGKLMGLPLTVEAERDGSSDSDDSQADSALTGLSGVSILNEAFDKLLGRLTDEKPGLCLILDDLDEAGAVTRLVIFHLLDQPEVLPVLVVATFVPEAARELRDLFSGATIDLVNLHRKEALLLGANLLDVKRLSSGLADLLWSVTDGHPLFIDMLMERLQAEEHIAKPPKNGDAALILDEPEAFSSLTSLVLRRADQLPDIRRKALLCASVLGDGFRLGAMATLLGQPLVDVPQASLSELVQDGWLEQSCQNRTAIYRFTNRLKRDILYESLPADQRTGLHLKAGDYYAAPRAGWRLRTEYAVHHYVKAESVKNALPIIEMALSQALAAGERDRVAAIYRMGIDETALDPELALKQAEWAEGLGDTFAVAGNYAQAAETYSQLGPTVAPLTLLGKLGLVLLAVDPKRATNILERALTTLMLGDQDDLRWRVEAGLVWGMALVGRSYEAIRRCRDSLGKLSDTVGFGSARTLMRGVLGMVLFYEGDQEEAYPHLESARAGWGARGDQDGVLLLNQVMIGMPKTDITRAWLQLVLGPLLKA